MVEKKNKISKAVVVDQSDLDDDFIDVVKYDNCFIQTNLSKLSAVEQDILMTICSTFTASKSLKQEIPFSVLREKAQMKDGLSEARFVQRLDSLTKKFVSCYFSVSNGIDFDTMPLFNRFKSESKKGILNVELNRCFAHYLYQIPEKIGFSQFLLDQFLATKSKYSKLLFREFRARYDGYWKVTPKELRERLGIPKSWLNGQIARELEESWLPDLEASGLFRNIVMEVHKARTRGSPIDRFDFTFKVAPDYMAKLHGQGVLPGMAPDKFKKVTHTETKKKHVLQPSEDLSKPPTVMTVEVPEEVGDKCPRCKGRVYEGRTKKGQVFRCCENTWYPAWHDNYFQSGTGKCKWFQWVKTGEDKEKETLPKA